jgi:predicted nucleic acid-binding protein
MNQGTEVCVDAGLAIKVVVAEPDSHLADFLFQHWAIGGQQLIAPAFFMVETDSILRQKVVLRRELSPEQGETAFGQLQALPIQQLSLPEQRQLAWEIACEFGFPTVYDATYLALASLRNCEFWTADQRLFRRVRDQLTFVRWLGDVVLDQS